MENCKNLTLDELRDVLNNPRVVAFRWKTQYEPAGGPGDKVFPPTYLLDGSGGEYAIEQRFLEGGEVTTCVLLDSIQSQANRAEVALLRMHRREEINLPLISVSFEDPQLKKSFTVTSLEVPHRIADAILRDSVLNDVPFRESEIGNILETADTTNATGLFGINPTSLLFGMWDSTGPRGGLGVKFQRAFVSEIVGYDVCRGVQTSSRIDPLGISKTAGPVYHSEGGGWTLDEGAARQNAKGEPVLYNKKGDPSSINHGNIPPSISKTGGGVTMRYAMQTTVLSLATLRRLQFPLNGKYIDQVDLAARATLAAMGLLAAALLREEVDLRSRCLLVPVSGFHLELIAHGACQECFSMTRDEAVNLFNEAVQHAISLGLPWITKEVRLRPSPELLKLYVQSQYFGDAD